MCSSLGTSRWLTKEELESLLVESVSPNDVRPLPAALLVWLRQSCDQAVFFLVSTPASCS